MKLNDYLKRVGVLTTALFAGPVVAHFKNLGVPLLNPPVGSVADYWLPLALFIGLLITLFEPFFFPAKKVKRKLLLSAVSCIAVLFFYLWAILHYGRPIVIPARHINDFAIVGHERTDFANANYSGQSDVAMLVDHGWSEDDIDLYWTKHSLQSARILTLGGFILTLCLLNWMIGVGAAYPDESASQS